MYLRAAAHCVQHPEPNWEGRRQNTAHISTPGDKNNSELWPFIMELMELSGRSPVYVKNCLSGHSWRWIREYSGNVSTNSTCNIIIICDGWSSCYKCMFPPRGFACMLDEQAPESYLIACVEVNCIRTRISIQSATASGDILVLRGLWAVGGLGLGFHVNVSVGIWGLEMCWLGLEWGGGETTSCVHRLHLLPSFSLSLSPHTTLCLINTSVTYLVTLNF